MRTFRGLAVVTAVAVYLQVVLGSVVRITGSGLGCRDWPLCYQHETDRFAYRTLLEVAHRVLGTAAGLLVLGTAVAALVLYRRGRGAGFPRGLWLSAAGGLGLYVFQAILGGVTVLMKNSPFTVAIHLGNAELTLGVLVLVGLWATRAVSPAMPSTAPAPPLQPMVLGMLGAYLVLVTGALMVGTGASGACTSWPLCGGSGGLADTHMLHRVVVLGGSVAILWAAFLAHRAWHGSRMAVAAYLTAAMLVTEAIVGAAQVLLALPPALRALHVALASAVWSGTVLLAAGAWLEDRRAAGSAPSRVRLAAVEARS